MTLEERAVLVGQEARKKCLYCEEPVRAAALAQLRAVSAEVDAVVEEAVALALRQERASALLRAARDEKEGAA